MYLVDCLDGVQVIDTRIKSDLIHDNDTSLLHLSFQLLHRRANVAGGDDVSFALDGGLDHGGVIGVGNERYNEVVCSDESVQRLRVIHIDRDGRGAREVSSKSLRGRKRAATCDASVNTQPLHS